MGRKSGSFNRSQPRFQPQPKVLIICEDSKSGLKYFEDASVHFRVDAVVEISHIGKTDPKGIVEYGLGQQHKFDRVFCVIDRDNHPSFDEAIELAKTSSKITAITSYPCFEYWLLLHFKNSRKPYRATGVHSAGELLIKDLRKCAGMKNYDKGDRQSIFTFLFGEKFIAARNNAPKVLEQAIAEDSLNPSTKVHLLVNELEGLSKPQPLA